MSYMPLQQYASQLRAVELMFARYSSSDHALRNIGIDSFDKMQRFLSENSLCEIGDILQEASEHDVFVKYPFNLFEALAEIVIIFAYEGIDVSQKIDEYVANLIERNVQYNEVVFWMDLKQVLLSTPREAPAVLEELADHEYEEKYTSVVKYIVQRRKHFTLEEVIPQEDYIELLCNDCNYKVSTRLRDIFSADCRVCAEKEIAPLMGFEMLMAREINTEALPFYVEDDDVLFRRKLCETISENNVLNPYNADFSSRVNYLECEGCKGETFLRWIAENSGNKVLFMKSTVEFFSVDRGVRKFKKDELTPRRLFEYIVNDS